MRVALLTDRLRVEERLLIESFSALGHEAAIRTPAQVTISLQHASTSGFPELVLDRGVATLERTTLAALLAASGHVVVNRPATARLLADRLALLRHLIVGGIPVPETVVSFGEEATFAAIKQLGFPVLLKSLAVDPIIPVALVEDQDAAEAIVEHRTTLGGERAVLVQRFLPARGRSIRAVVVDREVVGLEERRYDGWRPGRDARYEPYAGGAAEVEELRALAGSVIERLGSGAYAVEIVAAEAGPTVVGVSNLSDFRSLAERGIDIAGAIAGYAMRQFSNAGDGDTRG